MKRRGAGTITTEDVALGTVVFSFLPLTICNS